MNDIAVTKTKKLVDMAADDVPVAPPHSSRHQSTWESVYWPPYNGSRIVHDPSMLRAKGRSKFTRIKNEMDEGGRGTVRCEICKQTGHNRATCVKRSSGDGGGGSTSHYEGVTLCQQIQG
ncbi:unnamed protein product [Cuscuta europaea]|uniref:Uncharacterized protein n=1 Tax=Cuscuta europaea TaxID=41803 RepID=A0A9P1E288_CUSEU|nr:unnamed protein product [Cuscuta europaea]